MPALLATDTDGELSQRSLSWFTRFAWPVIEPGTTYLHNWHIDAICEYLEAVDAGQITRLLINVPPRYMKSITVSVMWPAWSWIRKPEGRWLFGSYSADLSTKHSVDRRTVIQSDWYQQRWADRYQLTTDQNVKTEYRNDRQGVMVATSLGGTATGKGGNRIVIDDPHNPKTAESAIEREASILSFDRTFTTRLDDKKRGAIVIVMQRLHESDLSAHVLKQGGYEHLNLPGIAAERTVISVPSGKTYTREAGDILWPEREGPKEHAQAKLQLGSYGYAGQYDQSPAPAGGGLFKSAWFRYWRREQGLYLLMQANGSWRSVPVDDCNRFAVLDVAGTEARPGKDPDYSVLQIWDQTPTNDILLVHQWRDRVELPDVAATSVREIRQRNCPILLVESNGIGLGVVQQINREGVAVQGVKSVRDKVVRSQTAQIRMEAGTIYFPAGAGFLTELEAELTTFPAGAHDDQVDDVSLASIHVHSGGFDMSIFDDGGGVSVHTV